jgi:hypothetical protein
MSTFAETIENVKKFDYDELRELKILTSKYINEIEREKLLKSHKDSIQEFEAGELEFSSDLSKLKAMLEY